MVTAAFAVDLGSVTWSGPHFDGVHVPLRLP